MQHAVEAVQSKCGCISEAKKHQEAKNASLEQSMDAINEKLVRLHAVAICLPCMSLMMTAAIALSECHVVKHR